MVDWPKFRDGPVHPRACGERISNRVPASSSNGSSPRMRGTAPIPIPRPPLLRFIPAHAGNGLPEFCSQVVHSVHPRACGERSCRGPEFSPCGGSSPRMRGTASTRSQNKTRNRFIPAHAGNGAQAAKAQGGLPVHPRACGERGRRPRRSHRRRRFIPAHAGNGLTIMLLLCWDLCAAAISTDIPRGADSRRDVNQQAPSFGSGAKLTSFSPSNSRGIRRLIPTVSKSKP